QGRFIQQLVTKICDQPAKQFERFGRETAVIVCFHTVGNEVGIVFQRHTSMVTTDFFEAFNVLADYGLFSAGKGARGHLDYCVLRHLDLLFPHIRMRISRVWQQSTRHVRRVRQNVDNLRGPGYSASTERISATKSANCRRVVRPDFAKMCLPLRNATSVGRERTPINTAKCCSSRSEER